MACKILKLGVFFDGTGNSKIPDSSKGQMSNIAKLSELYKEESFEENGKDVVSKMLYVNGVGTYDSEMATFFNWIDRKYDKGGGGGGAKRIYEMIDKVTAELDAHPYSLKKSGFIKREINVFGFSRGAAMARDFVNSFKTEKINKKKEYKDVKFNFIGIYDTVGSFGTPGNDVNMKPKREYLKYVDEDYLPNGMSTDGNKDFGIEDPQKGREFSTYLGQARGSKELEELVKYYEDSGWKVSFKVVLSGYGNPTIYEIRGTRDEMELFEPYNFNLSNKSAKTIVHMTANDEVRKNFPLTNTKGAGAKEYAYLGVHSDVGGGYPPESTEEFIYSRQIIARSKKEAQIQADALVKKLNAKIDDSLDEYEWYIEELEMVGVVELVGVVGDINSDEMKPYKLTLNKKVNNELALVTLQLMYEEAEFYKVPLKELNETVPSYLQAYYEFAKIHKTKAYEYENTNDGESIQDAFAHNSARDPAEADSHKTPDVSLYNAVANDEPESGNDARYVDESGNVVDGRSPNIEHLSLHVQREVFDNIPEKAIV